LIPQLSIVAAWIASLSPGFRAALIADEPWALMRGDLSSWSDDDRASLVGSLIESVERKQSSDSPYGNAEAYAKLKHSGLVAQLALIVINGQLSASTRRLGILIAEKCRLTELQPQLLQVALNESDHSAVRASAVSALKYCGDAVVPSLIRPLAAGEGGPDPNDDIKGHALELLWPGHMTASELFVLLTPSVDFYFGAYAHFKRTLTEMLSVADLLPALEWAGDMIARTGPTDDNFQDMTLADAIMFKTWEVFEETGLIQPLIENIGLRLRQHGELCRGSDPEAQRTFMSRLRSDVDRRRRFLVAVCAGAHDQLEAYSYERAALLVEADLEWLLDISPGGSHPVDGLNVDTLYNFIERVFVCEKVPQVEALYAAAERSPELRSRYASWFGTFSLDSPEVARFRAQQQLRALERNRPPPLAPDLSKRILALLVEAESGRWQAWWQLTCHLKLTPESRGWGDELDYFVTTMPGWRDSDEPLRRRIVASAEQYLTEAEINIDDWLGHRPMPIQRDAVAGLQAFILLVQLSPEGYSRIAGSTWRKWAPVIVGLPRRVVVDYSLDIARVLTDALRHASVEFVGAARTIIRLERERSRAPGATPEPGPPFLLLRDLDGCWGNGLLSDAMYDELCSPDNTPPEYAALLDALMEAGVEAASDHALSLLSGSGPSMPGRTLAIAEVLLRRAAVPAWPALWAAIASDDAFARKVLLHVATHFSFGTPFFAGLSEREIANLYVLMARLFPPDEDARRATGFIGALDSIGDLRDGAPRYLAGMGTEAAVEVLSELVAGHPEFSGLPYELSRAERAMRIATWSPLTSTEVLALTDKSNLQLVTSPADLCAVLVAALQRFSAALHSAQTPIRDLWDRQGGKDIFRPIDENALSDVVTRFLRAELGIAGIFANREVEVSRAPGAPVGQRTDILVNAVRQREDGDRFDPIAAVIETKGCWNPELFTALPEQLFREYMIPLRAQVGIYLVGWFDTDKWDMEDSRRNRVPRMTIEDASARLEAQAGALPDGFIVRPVVLECHVPAGRGPAHRVRGARPSGPLRSDPRK
jgi:hypothetical protein